MRLELQSCLGHAASALLAALPEGRLGCLSLHAHAHAHAHAHTQAYAHTHTVHRDIESLVYTISVLRCVALCRSVLQCVAVCCSAQQQWRV